MVTGWTVGTPVDCSICQRQVSESQAARDAPLGARRAHLVEERRPDVLGDLPALGLQPVGAGGAAAVVVRIDGVEAGNEPEQVHRRRADAVRLELARRVVRQLLDDRRESGIELAAVVQVEQELADVPGRIGDRGGVGVGQVKHLAVLRLERVGAGGRGAHDPVARPRERGQLRQVAARLGASVVVQAVRNERQAAALLPRHDHAEPVALEDLDRVASEVGLEAR